MSPFSLYIPKVGSHNSIGICPSATTLTEVTNDCPGVYYLNQEDTNVTIETIEGQEYWVVSGLTGTGGFGLTAATPELAASGSNLIFVQVLALVIVFLGTVYASRGRLCKTRK